MSYLIEHTVLYDGLFVGGHFNWFHALFVIVALAIMIYCRRKIKKMKDEMKDLEDQLSSKAADVTAGPIAPETEAPSAPSPAET